MKIYVDKKPESCGVCTLVNVSVLDVMENREMVLQHFCPILDLSVNPDNLDANCPLTELKPKELEWEEYDKRKHISAYGIDPNETCRIYISNTPIGIATIEVLINGRGIKINFPAIKKYLFSCKELITAKQSVENAKSFCQEHYNNLFWEMLGVKK